MDNYQSIVHVISKFWYLLLIPVLPALIKIPHITGCFHEPIVNFFACLLLNKKKYHRINDVILPSENGTALIDHIILSVFGIFVVKKTNIKGRIYRVPDLKTWIQKIHNNTNPFENPLYRNHEYVKILQSVLGLKDNQIHSVIVFTGNSTFKTDMPKNVTRGLGFIRFIRSKKQKVLSEFEIMEVKLKIIDARLEQSFGTDRMHVKNVRNIIREKEEKGTPVCPECSGSMLLREVKKGPNAGKKFWGCAKFPGCRGIVPVNNRPVT